VCSQTKIQGDVDERGHTGKTPVWRWVAERRTDLTNAETEGPHGETRRENDTTFLGKGQRQRRAYIEEAHTCAFGCKRTAL
jgi:hypothetical protein